MSDRDDRESEVVGQLGMCMPRCGMEEMKLENVSEKPERIVKIVFQTIDYFNYFDLFI